MHVESDRLLDHLPPVAALAVVLAFRDSELCACAGKLELTRSRAGRLALCHEVEQHIAAVGCAVLQFQAEILEPNEEETVQ